MHIEVQWFRDQFNYALSSKEGKDPFLTVKGCRIVNGSNGEFVSGPSSKKSNGDGYWNHTYMSREFQDAVLAKAQQSRPQSRPQQSQPRQASGDDYDDDIPF